MKKLMIAAATVCVAAMSQAAIVNWGTSSPISLNGTKLGEQTVQLFIVGVDGKDDVLIDTRTTVKNPSGQRGKLDPNVGSGQTSYNYTSTIAGGAVYGDDISREYYYKIVATGSDNKEYTYISSAQTYDASKELSPTQLGTVTFGFTDKIGEAGAKDVWTTAAVPEPTSGLLLLLGMAGLALRRRRA